VLVHLVLRPILDLRPPTRRVTSLLTPARRAATRRDRRVPNAGSPYAVVVPVGADGADARAERLMLGDERVARTVGARATDTASEAEAPSLALLHAAPPRSARPARAAAALALQRAAGNRAARRLLAREYAVAPTVDHPAAVSLTTAQSRAARAMNEVLFTDAAEIALLRAVLGLAREPSKVDDDFTKALAEYQASYGLKVDGMLGANTSERLARELTAEADYLGDAATGTERRRVSRRLHLRSMTSRTQGFYGSQGFVGPGDNPTGAVTVRINDTAGGTSDNISLEYTGEDADSVHWLQFTTFELFATPPGAAAPVFATGTHRTTNGFMTFSNPTTLNWTVDSVPGAPAGAPSPFYDTSGGMSTSAPHRRIAMIDEPGGNTALATAQGFAASGPAAGATSVTFRARFSSYVVKADRARYRVDWVATTVLDITAGTAGAIVYREGFDGRVNGLRPEHRAALLVKFARSPIN
jgi:hypothetical protein